MNKIIALIIMGVMLSSTLKAQEDTYRLDSIGSIQNKNVLQDKSVQDNNVGIKSRNGNSWQVFRKLFGIGIDTRYEFQYGNYWFDKKPRWGGLDKDVYSNLPKSYMYNDGLFRLKLHTPIFVFEQTFGVNFSQKKDREIGRRYERMRITSLGLLRWNMKAGIIGMMTVSDFDRRYVVSKSYDETYWRLGFFYSMIGVGRQHEVIRNGSITIDYIRYDNMTIDIKRKGWDFSMSGCMYIVRELYGTLTEIIISQGGDIEDMSRMGSVMNFIPIPVIDFDFKKSEITATNEFGAIHHSTSRGILNWGVSYLGFFPFPKIGAVLIPKAEWFYPKTFSVSAGLLFCF